MPRKATKTQVKKTRGRPRKTAVSKTVATKKAGFRWGESYTNVLLGIVVVIIGALFIVSLVKTRHTQTTSSTSTETLTATASPTGAPTEENAQKNPEHMYIVKEGDSLWTIAENTYHSGYNWVDIAKANNLENPDQLNAGTKLVLPSVTPVVSPTPTTTAQAITPTPQQQNGQAIKTTTYVIQPGDTLWDIAVRAYADGYKWAQLAQVNKLENPDLIFAGNTLQIPR